MVFKNSLLLIVTFLLVKMVSAQSFELLRKSGHQTKLENLSISPDNKYFISVDERGLAIIWDISTGQQFRVIKDVLAASFANDSRGIYLAMFDKTFKLVDLTGNTIKNFSTKSYKKSLERSRQFYPESGIYLSDQFLFDINKGYVRKLNVEDSDWGMGQDFSPVHGFVAVVGDVGKVGLYKIETGELVRDFKLNMKRNSINPIQTEFSADGSKLLVYKHDTLQVADVASGKIVRTYIQGKQKSSLKSSAISPNGQFVLAASYEKMFLINVKTGAVTWETKHQLNEGYGFMGFDYGLAKFTSDGKKIMLGSVGRFILVNAENGKIEKEYINSQVINYHDLFVEANGNILFTREYPTDYMIRWNLSTGTMGKPIAFDFSDRDYIPSRNGKSFFTSHGSEKENMVEIDDQGKQKWTYRTMPTTGMTIVNSVSFDGQYVVCTGTSYDPKCSKWVAEVYDTKSHKKIFSKGCGVDAVQFANTQNIIAVKEGWTNKQISFYNLPSGQLLYSIEVPEMGIGNIKLQFSPDDKYLFVTSDKDTRGIPVLDLQSKQRILYTSPVLDTMNKERYTYSNPIGFTPDSKYLLFNSRKIYFLNLANGSFDTEMDMPILQGGIKNISFVKNGRFAFVVTNIQYNGNAIKLVDMRKKQEVATLYPDGKTGNWAVVSSDGRFDASTGAQANMYHVAGNQIVPLSAMFERYYTPRLLARLLDGETFDPVPDVNNLKSTPIVTIQYKEGSRNLVVEDDDVIETINTNAGTAVLTVTAKCESDLVSEIRLYQNGKLVQTTRNLVVDDDITGDKILTKVFTVDLVEGVNHFKSIALNSQRTEGKPVSIVANYKKNITPSENKATTISGSQLHLIVVGINNYKNAKYNLNYANADAEAFKNAIETGSRQIFSKSNTIYIKDEQADKAGLMAAFEKVKTMANPEDLLVVYYAGHGVMNDKKEFFLVPYDVTQLYGNDDALEQKGMSASQIQQFSKDIKAQKQLFILDACQSAAAIESMALRGAAEEKAIAQLARSTGTHWLTASGSEQFASEFTQLGHGSFTYCILEALKGGADNGDKKLTVKELDAYLQNKVPEITQKYKGSAQYPASYGYGNDFPFIILK